MIREWKIQSNLKQEQLRSKDRDGKCHENILMWDGLLSIDNWLHNNSLQNKIIFLIQEVYLRQLFKLPCTLWPRSTAFHKNVCSLPYKYPFNLPLIKIIQPTSHFKPTSTSSPQHQQTSRWWSVSLFLHFNKLSLSFENSPVIKKSLYLYLVNNSSENDVNVQANTSTWIIEHSVGGSLMIQISLPQQQQAYSQHHRMFKYNATMLSKTCSIQQLQSTMHFSTMQSNITTTWRFPN